MRSLPGPCPPQASCPHLIGHSYPGCLLTSGTTSIWEALVATLTPPGTASWALGQLLTWLQVANCQMCARACAEALPARKPSRANKREVLRVQQGALLYLSFSSTAAWQVFSKGHWEALAKICCPSDCLPGDTTSCLRKMPHGNSTTLCPSSSSVPPQWTSLGSHLFPGASEDGLPTKEDCAGCCNCLILEDNRYM